MVTLKTGDYTLRWYEAVLAVERKESISEYANCLNAKRWADCLGRLNTFPVAFVLLEFHLEDLVGYPYVPSVHPAVRKKVRVRGPYLLRKHLELEQAHPNVRFVFAGTAGKAFAASVFKRVVEADPRPAGAVTPPGPTSRSRRGGVS